ncbi:MAG: DUF4321 domain-containing protein [Clostridia bacterium]|jgi:hypothetical protein|nr:DUF4321 domain-containing protein [Clostridia bacterium]MCI1958633.1 DUF4321 domain-containing protein [Clostridia bacterium]MCI2001137.1 DUF4321 domain-containing protein [Clostridia bacterium]MCI2015827.1 DUF4321 domain-containing protein [Clostridia bacterium]
MRRSKSKNGFVLVLMLLAGIVIGGFIGDYCGSVKALSWLGYGKTFGLTSPLKLDIGVLVLQFGLTIKFTIAGIIGIVVAAFIYRFI